MAASDRSDQRPFAVACGVLSRYVRASAAVVFAHPTVTASTALFMPGADISSQYASEEPADPCPAEVEPWARHPARQPQNQMTIMFGGCVAVFDGVPEDRAAEIVRVAAWQQRVSANDGLVATKAASLRRFMERRQEKRAAWEPYRASCPESSVPASENWKAEETDAGTWLRLGVP